MSKICDRPRDSRHLLAGKKHVLDMGAGLAYQHSPDAGDASSVMMGEPGSEPMAAAGSAAYSGCLLRQGANYDF
jgi:hypothetical protein